VKAITAARIAAKPTPRFRLADAFELAGIAGALTDTPVMDVGGIDAPAWNGLPHFGHAAALLLTSAPHSSHFTNAIKPPIFVVLLAAILTAANDFQQPKLFRLICCSTTSRREAVLTLCSINGES
jgi:hypothetical protein